MSAAQCFYPNGEPSKETDIPCGAGSGVGCCPSGWTCQINGLCYLANQQYYGRYTCTDKTWNSPGCPQICTYNNTASGNEAVLECSPGSFCCDTNRPELSGGQACCNASTDRFSIDGNVAMTVMSEQPASATLTPSMVQTTSAPSPNQTSGSFTPSSVIMVTSILNQDSGNIVTTVTSTPISSAPGSNSSPIGAIVGGAVGGAIAMIALALTAFFLLRRRQRRRRESRQVLRHFSLKYSLDSMYKDGRSLKSIFKQDAPSELVGSMPDLPTAVGEKEWEKRYESPGDVGRLLSSQRNTRDMARDSTLSQNVPDGPQGVADPPAKGMPKSEEVHELPGRSDA